MYAIRKASATTEGGNDISEQHDTVEVIACAGEHAGTMRRIPLYFESISAGFPSPADDYVERALDLNEYLVSNAAATFMVRVSGDSMLGAGILDGDILVVDRSRDARPGCIVVAVLNGELTVKRLQVRQGEYFLVPENPAYNPIRVDRGEEFFVWGVVSGMVRRF